MSHSTGGANMLNERYQYHPIICPDKYDTAILKYKGIKLPWSLRGISLYKLHPSLRKRGTWRMIRVLDTPLPTKTLSYTSKWVTAFNEDAISSLFWFGIRTRQFTALYNPIIIFKCIHLSHTLKEHLTLSVLLTFVRNQNSPHNPHTSTRR